MTLNSTPTTPEVEVINCLVVVHPSHTAASRPCMTAMHRLQAGLRLNDKAEITFTHKCGTLTYTGSVGPAPQQYVHAADRSRVPYLFIPVAMAAVLGMDNPIDELATLVLPATPDKVLPILVKHASTAMIKPLVNIWNDVVISPPTELPHEDN